MKYGTILIMHTNVEPPSPTPPFIKEKTDGIINRVKFQQICNTLMVRPNMHDHFCNFIIDHKSFLVRNLFRCMNYLYFNKIESLRGAK